MIRIHLIRHGKTMGNIKRQYIGSTDEPLCPEGIEALLQKKSSGIYPSERDIEPTIFTSPMGRCVETARVLYPDLKIEVIDGFQETDFGPFEGKTYEQLCQIPEYRNWIDSQGEEICPGMEKRSQMQKRCARALEELIGKIVIDLEANQQFVFIVHGGTIMALMQEFGIKKQVSLEFHEQNLQQVSEQKGLHKELQASLQESLQEGLKKELQEGLQKADNYYQYQRENGCGITCSLVPDGVKDRKNDLQDGLQDVLQNNLQDDLQIDMKNNAGKKAKIRLKWEGNIG